MGRKTLVLLAAGAATVGMGCRAERPVERPVDRQVLVWTPVGSWSGRASLQTDSFTSDTGAFQIHWASQPGPTAAPGGLRVSLYSAVSGRPLLVAVDHEGAGKDSVYVTEDPREFYLVIDSRDTEWSVRLDEGVRAAERTSEDAGNR